MRILSDMRAAGFTPRENHYAFLLREAAGRGAFEEAFAQLKDMVSEGVKPRLRSYAPLLGGLCNKVCVVPAMHFESALDINTVNSYQHQLLYGARVRYRVAYILQPTSVGTVPTRTLVAVGHLRVPLQHTPTRVRRDPPPSLGHNAGERSVFFRVG